MTEAFIKAVIGVVVTASWGFCVWLVKRAFAKQKETVIKAIINKFYKNTNLSEVTA